MADEDNRQIFQLLCNSICEDTGKNHDTEESSAICAVWGEDTRKEVYKDGRSDLDKLGAVRGLTHQALPPPSANLRIHDSVLQKKKKKSVRTSEGLPPHCILSQKDQQKHLFHIIQNKSIPTFDRVISR
jgi:hypothetical protein